MKPSTASIYLSMSSKRGRKRNDNLPPNRARDVQRAFRARRAAHLDALQQRVAELEEENSKLRAALNLPPANKPPLGKGPTGKDKPKRPAARPPRPAADIEARGRGGSSADSPTSTRAQSLSPSTITATVRPSPNAVHSHEGSSWDQSMLMGEEKIQQAPYSSSPSTGYRLPGLPAHTEAPSQYSYSSHARPSARPTLPGTMYMPASQDPRHFGRSTDRTRPEAYGSGNFPVRKRTTSDPREFSLIPSLERLAFESDL